MENSIYDKEDLSFLLYQKYYSLTNSEVEIILTSHEVISGKFLGFFKGDADFQEPYITKWHFGSTNSCWGADSFGFLEGRIIPQEDMMQITFAEDSSRMIFINESVPSL